MQILIYTSKVVSHLCMPLAVSPFYYDMIYASAIIDTMGHIHPILSVAELLKTFHCKPLESNLLESCHILK